MAGNRLHARVIADTTVGNVYTDRPTCAGNSVQLHPCVAHRVLPAAGRDHTAHVAGRAPPRQIPAVHNDPCHSLDLRHRVCT